MSLIQIGEYKLVEDKVFHDASFECAAWSQDVKVKAGTYPVFAEIADGRVKDFPGCLIALPGVIVADDFSSHFGGVAFSSKTNQKLGKEAKYNIQRYAHEVAMHILLGDEKAITLFPQFEARVVKFDYNGVETQTYEISDCNNR